MLTGPAIQELAMRKEWGQLEDQLEDALRDADGVVVRLNFLVHLAVCNYSQRKIDAGQSRLMEAFRIASRIHTKLPQPSLMRLALQCERYGNLARAHTALQWIKNLENDEAGRTMHVRLQEALNFAKNKKRLKIVALGQDCIPGDILRRWGFGRHIVEGPFNAGIFYGDSPIVAVEDKFRAFRDSSSLKHDNSAGGVLVATLPKYRICFNHETGSYWLERQSRRLLNLYAARIANFHEAIEGGNVLFIFTRISKMKIEDLWNVLQTIAPSPGNRLVVLDFIKSNEDLSFLLDNRISIIKTTLPNRDPKYVWHESTSFNTSAGLAWEREIVEKIQPVIQSMAQ